MQTDREKPKTKNRYKTSIEIIVQTWTVEIFVYTLFGSDYKIYIKPKPFSTKKN